LVYSFGSGTQGQLGINSTPAAKPIPTKLPLENIVQISAGSYHNLVLNEQGQLFTWGHAENGRLGDGQDEEDAIVPIELKALSQVSVRAIASGVAHSLVLTKSGEVYAWGYGEFGQLGIGSNPVSQSVPVLVPITGIVGIACGWRHSLAFKANGELYAWGWNDCGQVGNGTQQDQLTPVLIPGVDVVAAFCGGKHSMVITRNGELYGWGKNEDEQLSPGWGAEVLTPQLMDIPGVSPPKAHWNTHMHHFYCMRWKLRPCNFAILYLMWLGERDEQSTFFELHDIVFLLSMTLLSLPVGSTES